MKKMNSSDKTNNKNQVNRLQLSQEQIDQINQALSLVTDFGEIHLIIQRGMLKYINVLKSHKTWDDELPDSE